MLVHSWVLPYLLYAQHVLGSMGGGNWSIKKVSHPHGTYHLIRDKTDLSETILNTSEHYDLRANSGLN